eukprot:EG_transcript_7120
MSRATAPVAAPCWQPLTHEADLSGQPSAGSSQSWLAFLTLGFVTLAATVLLVGWGSPHTLQLSMHPIIGLQGRSAPVHTALVGLLGAGAMATAPGGTVQEVEPPLLDPPATEQQRPLPPRPARQAPAYSGPGRLSLAVRVKTPRQRPPFWKTPPPDPVEQLMREWNRDQGDTYGPFDILTAPPVAAVAADLQPKVAQPQERSVFALLDTQPFSVATSTVAQEDPARLAALNKPLPMGWQALQGAFVALYVSANQACGAITAMFIFSLGVYLTMRWVQDGWQALDGWLWARRTGGRNNAPQERSLSGPDPPRCILRAWENLRRVMRTALRALSRCLPPRLGELVHSTQRNAGHQRTALASSSGQQTGPSAPVIDIRFAPL